MSSLTATNSFTSRLYCTPALVYLILSIMGIVSMAWQVSAFTVVIKLIFVFVWAWFLNYLCSTGNGGLAWFLVFLPFLFILLFFFLTIEIMAYASMNGASMNNLTMAPR